MLLNMKFVQPSDNSEGEVDEDGNKVVKKPVDNSVTVTFPVNGEDSIVSLERRIRVCFCLFKLIECFNLFLCFLG